MGACNVCAGTPAARHASNTRRTGPGALAVSGNASQYDTSSARPSRFARRAASSATAPRRVSSSLCSWARMVSSSLPSLADTPKARAPTSI